MNDKLIAQSGGAGPFKEERGMEYKGLARKIETFREEKGITREELASRLCYINVADYEKDLNQLQQQEFENYNRAEKRGRFICKEILWLCKKKEV